MKYIYVIILLFSFLNLKAQSKATPVKRGLTNSELQIAEKMYLEMTKSETYILLRRSRKIIGKKLNGVLITPEEASEMMNDREYIKSWLVKNLTDTKFESVEEGVELLSQNFKLFKQKMSENKELYELMKRTTPEQLTKIMKPELTMSY